MNLKIGQVVDNSDILELGRISVLADTPEPITVTYVSPFNGIKGAFIAIPEIGATVLIASIENGTDWYYLGSVFNPALGDSYGLNLPKDNKGMLSDRRMYRARGVPQRYIFSSPKGNKLVLSDEYSGDYANIKASVESSTGKKIVLSDSPEMDCVIVENELGDRIKISSRSNGASSPRSIEIECYGAVNIISRQSSMDLTVVDGKELNITNLSTGSKRAGPNDPTPGNINITSKNADINITTKSKEGVVRVDVEGDDGHIILDSKGTVQINGEKGVSITSGSNINIEGERIDLN